MTDERWRPTPAEIRTETTAALATIRRAWPLLHNPTRTAGATRNPHASRPPVRTDTLSLIEEIARDLGFWVRALIEDDPEGDPQGLNLADAMGDSTVGSIDTRVILSRYARDKRTGAVQPGR